MPTTKRLEYRFTPTGQRSALIDPDGGRFTYSYDSVQRLTQVINPQGERTSYSYDAAGRRTLKKLANGSRTSFSYDAAGQTTTVAHLKANGTLQAQYDYVYDEVGNRTRMSELDGSITTWSYDTLDQLTAEHRTGTNAYRNTYTYDNRGNRTLKNLDGVRTTSSYDDANQLKWSQDASGRTTYTFDADGNQHVVLSPSGDRVTNLWDYENKLIGVLHPAGSRETMAYDPDGKRVKLQETASTTKYVWDDQNYLQETDAGDVTQVTYTNEPKTYGNLISQRTSSASHYYLFDALGSTRLVTDASENISESLLYDAWGNLITAAPTLAVPFRWVGELGYLFVPVTSDYYVRARVYQPGIGRWMSQDPLGFVDGTGRLLYCRNRIIVTRDPSGLNSRSASPVALANYNQPTERDFAPIAPDPRGDVISPLDTGYAKTCIVTTGCWIDPVYHPNPNVHNVCFNDCALNLAAGFKDPASSAIILEQARSAADIVDFVRANHCCQLIFIGHRGGESRPGGITTASPDGTMDITILPDETNEKLIAEAFAGNSCIACHIYLYTCNDTSPLVRQNQQRLATTTHCTVCGTRELICLRGEDPSARRVNFASMLNAVDVLTCVAPFPTSVPFDPLITDTE